MSLTNLNNDGIGLDGMDPVSYYNGESLNGSPEYVFELRGISYRFANEDNLSLFQEDPAMYIPDFAGSYLRDSEPDQSLIGTENADHIAPSNARLESRGMLQDDIQPLDDTIDEEMKVNPGYETDREVEMSNLSDSNA